MSDSLKRVIAALVVCLATASAKAEAPDSALEPAPRPWAIWVEPIGTALYAGITRSTYISTGVEVPAGQTWNWTFEFAFHVYDDTTSAPDYIERDRSFWFSTGPQIFVGPGKERLNGFFVHPKLLVTYSTKSVQVEDGPGFSEEDDSGTWTSRQWEIHAGLDVGFRFNFDGFYIAPVIGVSLGACFPTQPVTFENPQVVGLSPTFIGGDPVKAPGFTFGVNLNLLRIGGAF